MLCRKFFLKTLGVVPEIIFWSWTAILEGPIQPRTLTVKDPYGDKSEYHYLTLRTN